MKKNYINLSNGIEAIKKYNLKEYSFIRIQSTLLEQNLFEQMLWDLDNNFLMNLAIGNECIIYDYASRGTNKYSRAVWKGIPFIEFCLNIIWFNTPKYELKIKTTNDMTEHFFQEYLKLSKAVRKKLKYYRKFLLIDKLHLSVICSSTTMDGKYDEYKKLLIK